MWSTEDQINGTNLLAPIKAWFTMIMKHKEAAGAEVTVEFDENLIGRGGHALLDRVAAELTDLGRSLVRPIPRGD